MKQNIGRRIRNRLINSATAVLFSLTAVSYGSALTQAQSTSLDSTMGELSSIPGERDVGAYLYERLKESETPLFEYQELNMQGYESKVCFGEGDDGSILIGREDRSGNCKIAD